MFDTQVISARSRSVPAVPGPRHAVDVRPERAEPARPRGAHVPRLDIQGLRAVAVGLVVLYHLRPDQLSGGFVGVDVFFVISGFLIVGSLGREATRTGTISLTSFYMKRIRRLLPASALVLVVVMAATMLLLPLSRWQGTAESVLASTLQVQNWALAMSSGYAAATEAVSPLQHFWSLAVEEQFYLGVPLLLIGLVWLAGRLGRSRMAVVIGGIAVLTVASFVYSVVYTASNHDVAYFATTTRVWELTAGGLLALVATRLRLSAPVRTTAGLVGLAAICGSALTYTTAMAFPGWVAIVPVLGTVLVIAAGTPAAGESVPAGAGPATWLLSTRPATFVGDISYSLYLWHWPLIIFYGFFAERVPTKIECLALVAGSLALAWLSTRFVEEPFRGSAHAGRARAATPARAFRLAAVLVVTGVLTAAGPWLYLQDRLEQFRLQGLDPTHTGGAALLPEQMVPTSGSVVPHPAIAAESGPIIYANDCGLYDPATMTPGACTYGDPAASEAVVLVGDSHAAQFATVLSDIAAGEGLRLQAMVHDGCPFGMALPRTPMGPLTTCPEGNAATLEQILELKPRAVITSAMNPAGYASVLGFRWTSFSAQVEGYREAWAPLLEAGIEVVVLRDTPLPTFHAPECVERHGADAPQCRTDRETAVEDTPDPAVAAAKGLSGVRVVDLTGHLCNAEVCPAVIGNVLVYRDNHVTDMFARSLHGPLREALFGGAAS
ncbi:acyltransferase family protein [Blastococcus atacamensis]|uniref:acyltransferase family protein n=1 Tax=Blastococcus atacamensis TaxID=2070508 RepID=UPI0012FFDA04|nr:acyltransferase family protein [Blastococcus atacamensis]